MLQYFTSSKCSRHFYSTTGGQTGLHREMSGNLSFRDEKLAIGETLVSSEEINKGKVLFDKKQNKKKTKNRKSLK